MEAIKHKAMEYDYSMLKVYQYCYKLFSVIPSEIFLELYNGKEIEEECTTTDLEVIIKDQLYLQSEVIRMKCKQEHQTLKSYEKYIKRYDILFIHYWTK